MHKTIYAAALAIGSVSTALIPAPAFAQSYSASRVIGHFDIDSLSAVMNELDGTIESKEGGGYLLKFSNGTAATATFTVCDSGRCRGMNILGSFGKPSDKSGEETAELVRDYNQRWNAAKAYPKDDGGAYVQTYLIADGGITMDNFRAQLNVYSGMLKKMRETIYTNG